MVDLVDFLCTLMIVQHSLAHSRAGLNKDLGNAYIDENVCKQMKVLFSQKGTVERALNAALKASESNDKLPPKAREHQSKAIAIFQREINDTVDALFKSMSSLRKILNGDFRSINQLKEASKARLDLLKQAMITAEDDYNEIIDEEKLEVADEQKQSTRKDSNVIKKFINDLMMDLASAANDLESKLDDDQFEKELHDRKKLVNIETVIRIGDEDDTGTCNK